MRILTENGRHFAEIRDKVRNMRESLDAIALLRQSRLAIEQVWPRLQSHRISPEIASSVERLKTVPGSEDFVNSRGEIAKDTEMILGAYKHAYIDLFAKRTEAYESAVEEIKNRPEWGRLAENNYNLVELGPRETGKSYGYHELSPYTILLTGPTTVANLFFNIATGKIGLVGIWDAIGFDEVADLQKMPKEVVTTLKTYCESGTFARGKDSLSGAASIAMFGNTNQPVDVMVRTSHLFLPMPDAIREDMAFLDRIHFYIPGWEIPKMKVDYFTNHYGFVVDYLAEALRELRKHTFTETLDRNFSLGTHLKSRDAKAVRKTVSGLVKLIYPNGELSKDELGELVELSLEGRRRVKEQENRFL